MNCRRHDASMPAELRLIAIRLPALFQEPALDADDILASLPFSSSVRRRRTLAKFGAEEESLTGYRRASAMGLTPRRTLSGYSLKDALRHSSDECYRAEYQRLLAHLTPPFSFTLISLMAGELCQWHQYGPRRVKMTLLSSTSAIIRSRFIGHDFDAFRDFDAARGAARNYR